MSMAQPHQTVDPFLQEFQPTDLLETDFNFDLSFECPDATTDDISFSFTSFSDVEVESSLADPFSLFNASDSFPEHKHAQESFTSVASSMGSPSSMTEDALNHASSLALPSRGPPDRFSPSSAPALAMAQPGNGHVSSLALTPGNCTQGFSPSSAPEPAMPFDVVRRTSSLTLPSSRYQEGFLPSSPPKPATLHNTDTFVSLSKDTDKYFASGLPEPFSSSWSPCSASQSEPPKGSHKLSHGPGFIESSSIEFIQYTVDEETKKMKKFDSNADTRKGRKGKLSEVQRRDAGRMRKCDDGLYCKACVHYFKNDLIYHPCRGKWLDSLADVLLDGNLPWHPSALTLDDFLGKGRYQPYKDEFTIPINFSFGPPLNMRARWVAPEDPALLLHRHVTHEFPPTKGALLSRTDETHLVLPVVLTDASPQALKPILDRHLGQLVDHWFQDFPLFDSHLTVLSWIWRVYQQLEERVHSDLMQKTLKLLVLVHIGDVISVEPDFHLVGNALRRFAAWYRGNDSPPNVATPCFIRAQLGGVMDILAQSMLKEILETLEPLSLSSRCSDWFVVLAVNSLLVMAMETIQYHGHRTGFHALHKFPPNNPSNPHVFGPRLALPSPPPSTTETCQALESQGVDYLLKFYAACFGSCHSRLGATSSSTSPPRSTNMSRSTSLGSTNSARSSSSSGPPRQGGRSAKQRVPSISNHQQDVADGFIKGLRDAIAQKKEYLETCRQRRFEGEAKGGEDPMWLFDRLLARLLLTEG
ncbi:hypothetical protein EV356DRAFT_528434 [Viridothelium virens]|uniref:Uncharacterized protein n=1 Tax=Viridothelium virens TaxID=1048519 RepID=A0A6A6HLW1_VIRVR|nr:hypothetical protein EV356DRAFT_528434 [Viridothelium virens]